MSVDDRRGRRASASSAVDVSTASDAADGEVGGVDVVRRVRQREVAAVRRGHMQVSHGIAAVAVLPLTASGMGELPFAFHQKTGFEACRRAS